MGSELPVAAGLVRGLKRELWKLPPVRSLHHLRLARRDADLLDPRRPEGLPILVHQMAKVGSSTVHATLDALDPPRRPTLKVHYLSEAGARGERELDRRVGGPLYVSRQGALSQALGRRLRRVGDAIQLSVITLVRDPIAREVSALFQLPELIGPNGRDAGGRIDPDRVVALLRERFLRGTACLDAERWFDQETRDVFGIDVFSVPFPRDRGYATLRARGARLLVLRTEDLDRTLAGALQDFLDLHKAPRVVHANQRARTDQADTYRSVLARFRLPRDAVDAVYARRLARHFYSESMLEGFRRRWAEA